MLRRAASLQPTTKAANFRKWPKTEKFYFRPARWGQFHLHLIKTPPPNRLIQASNTGNLAFFFPGRGPLLERCDIGASSEKIKKVLGSKMFVGEICFPIIEYSTSRPYAPPARFASSTSFASRRSSRASSAEPSTERVSVKSRLRRRCTVGSLAR